MYRICSLEDNTCVRWFGFHHAYEVELSRIVVLEIIDHGVRSTLAFLTGGDTVMCSEVAEGVVSRFEAVWTAEAFLDEGTMLGHSYKSILVCHHLYYWRVYKLNVQQTP